MTNRRNYYRILHVQPDAPAEIIRSSYRALMLSLEMHPDRGGDHRSAALINEAYAVISDPRRRELYDAERETLRGDGPARRAAAPKSSNAYSRPASVDEAGSCSCVFCGNPHGEPARMAEDPGCDRCGCPLVPAGGVDVGPSGRRSATRLRLEGEIRFFTDWPGSVAGTGRVLDLSPRGMRCSSNLTLRQYEIVKIEAAGFGAAARVAYCSEDETGSRIVGLEFYTVRFRELRGTFLSVRG